MKVNLIFLMLFIYNFQFIYSTKQGPDFIVIGAQKAGTSSIFQNIKQHPQVKVPDNKELHFFDWHFDKGLSWYYKYLFKEVEKSEYIFGEATPDYFFSHNTPQRICEYFSNIKFIIILRNPVERAVSQYKFAKCMGVSLQSFDKCVDFEIKQYEKYGIIDFPNHNNFSAYPKIDVFNKRKIQPIHPIKNMIDSIRQGFVTRGIYIDQIENWFSWFKKEQFLVLNFEDLENKPDILMNKIFSFLNINPYHIPKYTHINKSNLEKLDISLSTIVKLKQFYQPFNKRLEEFLGVKFNW